METRTFEVASARSNINWTGKKVTGAHNGTIAIKSGTISLTDDNLGGNFVIDIASLKILDVTDPATNAQFEGHLFSNDFFSADRFPEAFFTITGSAKTQEGSYLVSGNLTIKDITNPVTFSADLLIDDETLTASGKIIVDRTLYNMKFRSGNFFQNLGDTLIYNEFELDVKLTALNTL
ncbi:YceI family protein [Dyadobacter sp. 3J3]|uniref:YceI family protein n=1 Tax=Dyadobacter sp. 3J3 TaxID=2606600 RepID=UPI00135CA3DD|nr:YceI family protein [Dyadobacter sp. 3J3]